MCFFAVLGQGCKDSMDCSNQESQEFKKQRGNKGTRQIVGEQPWTSGEQSVA